MTAIELIEKLQTLPPTAHVIVYSMDNYHASNVGKVYYLEKMGTVTVETHEKSDGSK